MVDKSISLYSDSNKIDVSVNEKKARKGKSLSASTHYLFLIIQRHQKLHSSSGWVSVL